MQRLAPELAARTVLIEKDSYPRDKLCGGGITPVGTRALARLNVALPIPRVTISRIEFRFEDEVRTLKWPNALHVIRRVELDHALANVAVERGLSLRQGEAFVRFERKGGALLVVTDQGEYEVRALIGADGVHSRVRQSMGLEEESRVARLIEIVRSAKSDANAFRPDTAIFDFSDLDSGLQGYVWHFPCAMADRPAMNHGIYDSRVQPERDRADLKRLFTHRLEAAQVTEMEPWGGHPLRWLGEDSVLAIPGVFLIGDAAGVDAVLGEGIAPALEYGDFAARILIDAFQRNDFSFTSLSQRLFEHPLGRSLVGRHRIAQVLYAKSEGARERVKELLEVWLPRSSN